MAIFRLFFFAKRTASATSFADVTSTIASGERPTGRYLFQIRDCRVLSNVRAPRAITRPSKDPCKAENGTGAGAAAALAGATGVIRLTAPAPIMRKAFRRERSESARLMLGTLLLCHGMNDRTGTVAR